MKIITLIPGSPDWLQSRSASKAPAVMGDSNYQTRNELLHQMTTGITKEIDAATQARFDNGHQTEALSRVIAEEIIGEELSPIGASDDDGYLTANFDGITFSSNIAYEHKAWNEKLAESVRSGVVPESHAWQLDQQILVGKLDYVLFVVSDGTKENFASIEYRSTKERADSLMAGWRQFDIDLANYQHVDHVEMPKAQVTIDLPALFVHAKGEITEHNLEAFGVALTAKLVEVRSIALVTDQDFSNAKDAAKKFRDTAKEITLSEAAMLAQTETIGEASRKMKAWVKDLNATALQLEKDVEREDLAKKRVMVGDTGLAYSAHVEALESETRPIQLNVPRPNFTEAIKGKRNYASMQSALDDMLAQGKIEADATAKDVRTKLAWCKETSAGFGFLFNDLAQLLGKPMDDFQLTVTSRIKDHQSAEAAKVEALRVAMQAEADAKAKSIADAEIAKAKAESDKEAQRRVDEAVGAEHARLREEQRVTAQALAEERAVAEAKAIEERRKAAQIADQTKPKAIPVSLSDVLHAAAPEPIARAISPKRPTDKEIIAALADGFQVSTGTVCDWILEIAETMKEAA